MDMATQLFFFNDTATTEIYTLSLHDALPISSPSPWAGRRVQGRARGSRWPTRCWRWQSSPRSEEHTSELQSQSNLVCRLLLEKKKYTIETSRLIRLGRQKLRHCSLQTTAEIR